MAARFDGLDDDVETTHLIAATVAAEQVLDLTEQGVREFHFYTLNRAALVYAICHPITSRRRPPCPPPPWPERIECP
jgi:methylenetetrahydrofolate reductase (NADPH)